MGMFMTVFVFAFNMAYPVLIAPLFNNLGGDTGLINAVVGHEIGHSILQHTWILLGATMANLFVLMRSFGYKSVNTFLRLQCSMQVYMSVIMPFWSILMNGVTRKLEFQADRYSTELGLDISSALVQISKTNKGDLNPDWLHSRVHHTPPPLLE